MDTMYKAYMQVNRKTAASGAWTRCRVHRTRGGPSGVRVSAMRAAAALAEDLGHLLQRVRNKREARVWEPARGAGRRRRTCGT